MKRNEKKSIAAITIGFLYSCRLQSVTFAYIAENGIGKLLMRTMMDYINISYI